MNAIPEPKPLSQGYFRGQLSPGGYWFWNGTGRPDDAWEPNPNPIPVATAALPIPLAAPESGTLYPTRGDNTERSALKTLQNLYNANAMALTPPFPGGLTKLYPTRGDTAEESARKMNAVLYATYPPASLPALPSPHVYFAHLDPHSGDTLAISLAKINALTYLKNGGTP